MRPASNLALHAMLATGLAALASPSVAGQEQTYFTITLQDGTAALGRNDGRMQQIEIQSFRWGASSSAGGLDAGMKQLEAESRLGDMQARDNRAAGGMVMKGSKVGENSTALPGGVRVASGDVNEAPVGGSQAVTVGGGQTESGQATGKRQHMPLRARAYYDSPLPQGSVRIKVKFPWLACRVGAHYPSLALRSGGKQYQLQDVTVASCGGAQASDDRPTEEVAFYYNKISF